VKLGSFLAAVLGIAFAGMLHLAFLLFGGLLFGSHKQDHGTLQVVELVSEDDAKEDEEEPEEATSEATDELEAETEEAPDAAEVIRNLEQPAAALAPALEAASLSAIEAALSGQGGGGGDFAEALSFQSGGRIGGMGKASTLEEKFDTAFSLSEMDQKPRAIFQATPVYPAAMRGKDVEGVVSVIFVVDPAGKVASPRIEKSSHTAFSEPALDAVKQWKFEPGVKAGQRAACRMRVSIRFPLS
jgi:periplasmic protein TonB